MLFAWCRSTEASIPRCGLLLNPSRPRLAAFAQTLNEWVKRDEIDTGARDGVTTTDLQRLKELERENKELRRANEILKLASAFFAQAELDRRPQVLRDFIDKHRDTYGVEPICKVLQIAPSGYRRHVALRRNPEERCARARRDEALVPQIERVWMANMRKRAMNPVLERGAAL